MPNNAEVGMTIQKIICDKYNIIPHPNAIGQFESGYNPVYKNAAEEVIDRIFTEIDSLPVSCLTFSPSLDPKETFSPHNFILADGSTLSIRTNLKGDKVAPRVVGQAGIQTFNDYFSHISGYEVSEKSEIKKVVYNHIHSMLPVFLDYIFISDYTVWIQINDPQKYDYTIFNNKSIVDIALDRDCFTFTRDLETWNESTTLKYNGVSLAEIQIHKNRTFKFRFIMNALSKLLKEQSFTTETMGITAEKAICDLFTIKTPPEYYGRYSPVMEKNMMPTVKSAFKVLPKAIRSTGAEQGSRGGASKCSYDFVLEGEKTLSLKTNTGKMICPPEVGQPGASTCYLYFKDFITAPEMTPKVFKEMVFNHIDEIMPIYVEHLFDSDYLLWIYQRKDVFYYKIFDSNFAKKAVWDASQFDFTKNSLDEWNESNTVKYAGVSIGEFQIHKKRSCYKFRFNMENFELLINSVFSGKELKK